MASGKIGIVILNWNGWNDTIECLESVFKMTYPSYNVFVVDNGSTDGSVARISEWGRSNSRSFDVIPLDSNKGYAAGNNTGIKKALADPSIGYILILNNDTVVKEDLLDKLMQGFDVGDKVALVGPKILGYKTGRYQPTAQSGRINFLSGMFFFTPLRAFALYDPLKSFFGRGDKRTRKVYVISGCCMLFRREALEEIGAFDEHTFLGWEEYIIAEKLYKKGYRTNYVGGSEIYHKWGQSTMKLVSADKAVAFIRSGDYFIANYLRLPAYQRYILKLLQLLIYTLVSPFNASYRRSYPVIVKAIFGIQDNSGGK